MTTAIHTHVDVDVRDLPEDPRIDTTIAPDGELRLTLRHGHSSVSLSGSADEIIGLLAKLGQRADAAQENLRRRRLTTPRYVEHGTWDRGHERAGVL